MKLHPLKLWQLSLALLLPGCSSTPTEPTFPEQPSRAANEGFQWEEIRGAGLRLWTQYNDHLQVVADNRLPGLWVERNSDPSTRTLAVRIFELPGNDINSLLPLLQQEPGWDASQTCTFEETPCDRPDVKRYRLVPTDSYADSIRQRSSQEPIPVTCNGWGMGNSGIRYFEVHANRPDRALFLEIGQDAPLYDEQSIVFDGSPIPTADSVQRVTGQLIIGHEVRSFTADNDTVEYWVVDRSGRLAEAYDSLTGGVKNGTPVHAELRVIDRGTTDEGFAAEYAGVYQVVEVIGLQPLQK